MEQTNDENTQPEIQKPVAPVQIKNPSEFWDIIKFAFIALLIVIPIRIFVAQPFRVSGTSMVPTFQDKQYLIVDEISYRFENPARGDVIILHPPQDPSVYYIKRIVGLPGETISIDGSTVTIKNAQHPDGFVLDESYVVNKGDNHMTKVLGPTEYFVMGDNRPFSSDSRSWGVLPRGNIVGRPILRLFPPSTISVFPGAFHSY